jgi:sialidase-1
MKISLLAALLVGWSATAVAAEPLPAGTDVFVSGKDGYFAYRIPAIEVAPDGSLLAVAEARKYTAEDPGYGVQEIDLVYKRSTDNGATWSPMMLLEHAGEYWAAANPDTVVDRTNGKIWVFYVRARPQRSSDTARPGTDDMRNLARWSSDNGQTWSEPIDMTAVARDLHDSAWKVSVPGPGGAIQTRQGRLIVAMWKCPSPALPSSPMITAAAGTAANWSLEPKAEMNARSWNWAMAEFFST